MNAAMREAINITAMIRAAEDWSTEYSKDPKTHAKLIKLQSTWEVKCNKLFKDVSAKEYMFMNWHAYSAQVKADYNIDVIIDDGQLDSLAGDGFLQISVDLLTEIMAVGAQAGESIYGIKLGLTSTNARIQQQSLERVAALVGKKVLPNGQIVDNPNAAYSITDTMREQIAQSVKTSLALGESVDDARSRMQGIIEDDYRAEVITRTESVNAYQGGLKQFADESNAVAKEWQSVGSTDECQTNSEQGPIPIDDTFASGDSEPAAHPNCSCGIRYIYQSEWDSLSD